MTDKKVPESFHRYAPYWPDLEDKLETFVMQQRAACKALNTVQLWLKELAMAEEMKINNFQGTVSWCFQFMKRKNLTIRQHTTLSKALPEDQEEMIATFQALVSD